MATFQFDTAWGDMNYGGFNKNMKDGSAEIFRRCLVDCFVSLRLRLKRVF